jgi:hypothetical protein
MAWREVSPDPVAEPTPREIIRAMIKPRTYDAMWGEFVDELRERDAGAELPEDFEDFNLSAKPNLEME